VLLEQPGAWGADVLDVSDLPRQVAAHLRLLAATLPARVLLLRRPAGETSAGTGRTLYAGVSAPDGGWLERFDLARVEDVLGLDLGPLGDGHSVGGRRVRAPLYLVCTNGKHDPCCAEYGLPVARALAAGRPSQVWECSHVGGDRFAGNLVCLPEGLFYGHLDAASALAVVDAHEQGHVLLERWRGRSSLPFAAQAAEALVRQELGIERVDGIRVTHVERDGPRHVVRLARRDGGRLVAVVTVDRTAEARPLTCAGAPAVAPTYRLDALREPTD
jgi:(2Fe-2S) ferredoxin